MPTVELSEQEWQQVITLLGTKCLWVEVNMLLMKIGNQLREQAQATDSKAAPMESAQAH